MGRGAEGLGPFEIAFHAAHGQGSSKAASSTSRSSTLVEAIAVCVTWTWHIDAAEVTQEDEQISHGHDIVSVQVPGTRAAFKFACSVVGDGCRVVIASVCIGASGVVEVACAQSIEGEGRCVGGTVR